jgi:hypothetical protein
VETRNLASKQRPRRAIALPLLLPLGVTALVTSPLFSVSSSAADFSNSTAIVIPSPGPPPGCPNLDDPTPNNNCPPTTAEPYPSDIPVSGVTGTLSDVNVTLKGLTTTSPADLDIIVQAPNGTTVWLMSDACGPDNGDNAITSAIDLTFDDAAASTIPEDTQCTSGTFKPVDDDNDPFFERTGEDVFPSPAPTPSSNTALSAFNGSDPNGTWKLWVVDDYPNTPGDPSGRFAGGWSLSISTGTEDSTTTTSSSTDSSTSTSSTSSSTPSSSSTTSTTAGSGGSSTTSSTVASSSTTISTLPPSTTTTTELPRVAPAAVLQLGTVQGGRVTVTGSGFPDRVNINLYFFSDPVLLATVLTNAQGGFQTTVAIPADAAPGAHQIVAVDALGRALASAPITVPGTAVPAQTQAQQTGTATQTVSATQQATAARTSVPLARTGPSERLALVALALVLEGCVLVRAAGLVRRRRSW